MRLSAPGILSTPPQPMRPAMALAAAACAASGALQCAVPTWRTLQRAAVGFSPRSGATLAAGTKSPETRSHV